MHQALLNLCSPDVILRLEEALGHSINICSSDLDVVHPRVLYLQESIFNKSKQSERDVFITKGSFEKKKKTGH